MNNKVIKLITILLIIIMIGMFLQNVVYADAVVLPFMKVTTENGTVIKPMPTSPKEPEKTIPQVSSKVVTIACVSTVVILLIVYILVTNKSLAPSQIEANGKVDNKETNNKDNIEKGE